MCTFLPGVVLYGCEEHNGESIHSECGQVTEVWFRLVILLFYQTQFAKPLFYCAMDNELAKGVRKFWARAICG